MNRKERRAAGKRGRGGAASSQAPGAGALFAQAIHHHRLGQLLDAEAHCRAILAHDPKHIGSLHLLGVMAQQCGQHEQAEAQFRKVIRLKPEIATVHYSLGCTLAELGKIEEAMQSIERARMLDARGDTGTPPQAKPDYAGTYLNLGNLNADRGRMEMAAKFYERALALKPDYAEAHNNLGAMLLSQGRLREASGHFVRALELTPELVETFANVVTTLYRLNPTLKQGVSRATEAWPRRLSEPELLGSDGITAIVGDTMLRHVLEFFAVRDIELERLLTSLRLAVLRRAADAGAADIIGEDLLRFCCALARQCFINEYVFAAEPEEFAQALALRQQLIDALAAGRDIPPLWLAAVASYFSLNALPDTQTLLDRTWPDPVMGLLTQHIREVLEERQLLDSIPRLTAIEDDASVKVRQQYEDNPYPRWVVAASRPKPLTIDEYLRQKFPTAPFRPIDSGAGVDVLIAGCGTGQHPIGLAQTFRGVRVLAIDLSLASLSYALRKTREIGLRNIEYAQADLLRLGSLGRTFDAIDASGVLHHLADPMAGWRVLLPLLRPNGMMRIGLYSELGRRDVVAAQRFVAEHLYRPTPDDIRRCRHELMATPLRTVAKFHDFFSTSECRDLLFHVQEHRHTIPQIEAFLREQSLKFIGFENDSVQHAYRKRYPDDRAMTDLAAWHALESEQPDTFAAMYQFWIQKS